MSFLCTSAINYFIYIFIYSTLDIFTVIFLGSAGHCYFIIFRTVSYSNQPNFSIYSTGFLQLPSSGVPCSTELKQLLKYQLEVWVAPLQPTLASYSTNYGSEDI